MLNRININGISGQWNKSSQSVMLLGGFDGLHAGHKTLVEKARGFRLPIGIMTIIGGKEERGLFTLCEREDIFSRAGLDFVLELPFAEIKDLSPQAFALLLMKECNPVAFVCGDDFRFGKNASGTPEALKRAGQVRVEAEKLLMINGEKVSSSKIKAHLCKGEIEQANELLGEAFFLMGEVVKDRGVGKTLGFPTANVVYPKEKYPLKYGVYETRVCINGKEYKGITNYGNRPTFENDRVITETYMDGFDGNLYGKPLKIGFTRYLRAIEKFENAEALVAQLREDIRRVRENDSIRTERKQ